MDGAVSVLALRVPVRAAALAVGALAAGVLALVVAFLYQHRPEIDALPDAARAGLAALRRDGVARWPDAAESAAGALAAALVVAAWYGLGDLVVRLLERAGTSETRVAWSSRALDAATRCGLGAGIWALAWVALGLGGLYRPSVAAITLGVGLALAGAALARRLAGPRDPRRAERDRATATRPAVARVAAALVVLPVALACIASLAPPTAKDTL